MAIPDDLIETMVQAAVTEAFQQKGMSRDQQLKFDATGQDYNLMGIDLKHCMVAAIAAIESSGWTISRIASVGSDVATAVAQDRGVRPDELNAENDG